MTKPDCKKLTLALLKSAKCNLAVDTLFKVMKVTFTVLIWMCFVIKALKICRD